jgi:hypothetical protein
LTPGPYCGRKDYVNKKNPVTPVGIEPATFSLEITAHRVTSMADTVIDAIRKQKKAEYAKQYRLKRKLLLQQQASKDIYMIR